MHELSVATSIVELVEQEAETRGLQVEAVHLKLGPLSGVMKDALLFSYEVACEGTPLAGSRLIIEEIPIVAYCPSCQAPRPITSMQWFCCSICNTPTSEVVQGKELEVVALEVLE